MYYRLLCLMYMCGCSMVVHDDVMLHDIAYAKHNPAPEKLSVPRCWAQFPGSSFEKHKSPSIITSCNQPTVTTKTVPTTSLVTSLLVSQFHVEVYTWLEEHMWLQLQWLQSAGYMDDTGTLVKSQQHDSPPQMNLPSCLCQHWREMRQTTSPWRCMHAPRAPAVKAPQGVLAAAVQ